MLSVLHIENIAVIEEADLCFDRGFNVLTGETGAGKSIVIDAIGAVTGQRVSRDLVRTGAQSAQVSGVFVDLSPTVLAFLAENGLEAPEGELLVSRELMADGRNLCRLNGRPVTVAQLRALGMLLLNIHGQHDNQQMLSEASHLGYLDSFGRLGGLLEAYGEAYRELKETERALQGLRMDEAEKARRMDQLSYAIQEIEAARLRPGEDEELLERRKLLQNAGRLAEALQTARGLLLGDEDSLGALAEAESASQELSGLRGISQDLDEVSDRLSSLLYELEDVAETVRDLGEGFEFSPGELDEIEERLDTLYKLRRKYGDTAEEILAYLDRSRKELEDITFSEERAEKFRRELEKQTREAKVRAEKLSKARRQAAQALSAGILEELQGLDMGKMRFQAELTQHPEELNAAGMDSCRFLISANRGEPLKPLNKVASGGELARIMLAMKSVLAGSDQVGTMVFDEVDTGVSGRAAQRVGEKLSRLGGTRQVLCVTHLPQITALADTHFLIEKGERGERTVTSITKLNREGRREELARMIGGDHITETTRKNASELLEAGESERKRRNDSI